MGNLISKLQVQGGVFLRPMGECCFQGAPSPPDASNRSNRGLLPPKGEEGGERGEVPDYANLKGKRRNITGAPTTTTIIHHPYSNDRIHDPLTVSVSTVRGPGRPIGMLWLLLSGGICGARGTASAEGHHTDPLSTVAFLHRRIRGPRKGLSR